MGKNSDLVEQLIEEKNKQAKEFLKKIKAEAIDTENEKEAFDSTMALMKAGVKRIYRGYLMAKKDNVLYKGRPDFLEKREGKSALGDYYYVAVDIRNANYENENKSKPEHRLQLALYSWILKEIQNFYPEESIIINRNSKRVIIKNNNELSTLMWDQIKKIRHILEGNEPALKINSNTKDTPWHKALIETAIEKDDIALLHNINEKTLEGLRENGIKTIRQMAAIETDALPKIKGMSKDKLEQAKWQAKSLKENKVIWLKPVELPSTPLNLYFDIERNPFKKMDYLYGVLIDEGKNKTHFKHFLAKTAKDESNMWNEFLKWLKTLQGKEYTVYHYSPYETSAMKRMEEKYGSSKGLVSFMANFIDLAKVVKESIVFPIYSYSIKDIAQSEFLNYKWRNADSSGIQSIAWHKEWMKTNDEAMKNKLIDYNEDDVIATKVLHRWLTQNSPQE